MARFVPAQQLSERARAFLRQVAEELVAGPEEIAIFVAFLITLIGIISAVTYLQHRDAAAQWKRLRRQKFTAALDAADLGPAHRSAVDIIVSRLPRPDMAYRIVESEALFHHLSQACIAEGILSSETVSSLRRLLPFERPNSAEMPLSTASLGEGRRVYIQLSRTGKPIEARVQRQLASHFELRAEGLLRTGPCRVMFSSPHGLFAFATRIAVSEQNDARLLHSERVLRVQKRSFVRAKASMAVYYRLEESDNEETARTIDIGGGGCSFYSNVDMSPGSSLDLRLLMDDGELHATATLISAARGVCRLSFVDIAERDRDRIIKHCLLGSTRNTP